MVEKGEALSLPFLLAFDTTEQNCLVLMYYNHNPLIGNMVHHKLKPMLIRFKIKLLALTCLSLLLTSCEPDNGELIELNCSTASTSGTIIQGSPATNVVVNVSYTSDGDGSYESQTIQSTGVLGLTATLSAGNFSDGSGTLSYTISGTPQSSGVASFAISVGGQSCTLTIQINTGSPATCGASNVHNPAKTYGNMTDQQGNVYKTIVIGGQEWMAENLKTSIYRNGEDIANVTYGNQWGGLTTGAWCYHNNDSQYECPYGKLYNWFAVADPRGLCPSGWHLPSYSEWGTLTNSLNTNIAGGKMKSTGLQYWLETNYNATNESGFSGLPGGWRFKDTFEEINASGYWWSSTELGDRGMSICMERHTDALRAPQFKKETGLSVRCVKD